MLEQQLILLTLQAIQIHGHGILVMDKEMDHHFKSIYDIFRQWNLHCNTSCKRWLRLFRYSSGSYKNNNVTFEISTLIPNAISPNGDGKNDVWKLDFLSLLYPNASVKIYNRWGEEIYRAEGSYDSPWDGTYKGQLLPVGTYYYVLELNDPKSRNHLKEVFF